MRQKPRAKARLIGGAAPKSKGGHHLHGRHAVVAALANPRRKFQRLVATSSALAELGTLPSGLKVEAGDNATITRLCGEDAVHQGMILYCDPLEPPYFEDALEATAGAPILVLDQVTDPHNVGAILRSAAAFGAGLIVTQDRHSPPESPTLAKAASGALELIPWARVVNLARVLDQIAEASYWRIALDGDGKETLAQALPQRRPVCLVLGAEGRGLRPGTLNHCDQVAHLPISDRVESLNVSNAAAVALYALRNRGS